MRVYGYQNKGVLLLEHLISILIICIFLNILFSSLIIYKKSSISIENDIRRVKAVKILDRIKEKILVSKSFRLSNNRIYLDDTLIRFNKKSVSANGVRVLNYDEFELKKINYLLIIVIRIKDIEVIRWISLK